MAFMQLNIVFAAFVLPFFFTCLLILCSNLLNRVLIAIVLLDLIAIIGLVAHDLALTFLFSVQLLVILLILTPFFSHSFLVLEHHLVLLNHSLQVLKDHLARKKASYQSLHLDDTD